MSISDAHANTVESIELAISHLGDALVELDRLPTQDKSATIGLVAQALNSHLHIAEATLDLLSDALREHPNPDVARWITGLRHLGNLMQHTISRLAHTSAPGDFPLKAEQVDLPLLMKRACNYYRAPAERKQVRIECNALGTVPPAWGDRVAVAVVADNLLSNAVRFSPAAATIQVQVQPGPGGVVCTVTDEGPGLSTSQQSRLFQRSMRSGPPAKTHKSLPDYGLTIVIGLVERMGGRVRYETEGGRGSSFSFSLPYTPLRQTPEGSQAQPAVKGTA